ncbi:hypothetical protein HF325_006360 [Metschnikowia pulcherrima]|uniref:Uncharacterized protein n=1 Tax=Metschnikowia pulcherrima TaxID=27326 RepID=A0A8H7L8H5_9ASCO|nr:hypothetical protein HF325_006360 [Metschnikowia pulcherrima]
MVERERVSLFPEFYFHFKKNFERTSMLREACCKFGSDVEDFKARFSGSRKEKYRVLEAIELSF